MKYLPALLAGLLLLTNVDLQAQKKLVIIGSSTSACTNVNSVTECYVGRLNSYYNQQAPLDTGIDNHLALGGTNCYNGMPSSYVSPYSAPYTADPTRNITAALALNPDVIIVNYPSNGYDVLRVDSILYCLRTIRDSANKKGIPCFVTTTQPRTNPGSFNTSSIKAKMAELKDSILLQFGYFALDFYTGLINPADSSILYDSGDGVHMSAAGHNVMYQRILAKNIFLTGTGGALPARFIQFNTVNKNSSNIVQWTSASESGVDFYEIQRSTDGISFSGIGKVNASNNTGNLSYQFTDDQPAKGWNYYKIIIVDRNGQKHASAIMSVRAITGKKGIVKTFATTAQVVVELQSNTAENIQLQLLNNMGVLISRESRKIEAGTNTLYLNTPALSNGVYHVRLIAGGETLLSSFIKTR